MSNETQHRSIWNCSPGVVPLPYTLNFLYRPHCSANVECWLLFEKCSIIKESCGLTEVDVMRGNKSRLHILGANVLLGRCLFPRPKKVEVIFSDFTQKSGIRQDIQTSWAAALIIDEDAAFSSIPRLWSYSILTNCSYVASNIRTNILDK